MKISVLFVLESVSYKSYMNRIGVSTITHHVHDTKTAKKKFIYFNTPGSSFSWKLMKSMLFLTHFV